MRFYNQQHKNYCGIDLHVRKMVNCIIDQKGKMKVHQNIKTDTELLFEIVFPFLDDIVIGVECVSLTSQDHRLCRGALTCAILQPQPVGSEAFCNRNSGRKGHSPDYGQ